MATVILNKIHPNSLKNLQNGVRFEKGFAPWNKGTANVSSHICKKCGVNFTTKRTRKDRSNNYCSVKCSVSALHTPEIIRKRADTWTIKDRDKLKKSDRFRSSAYMEWRKKVYMRDTYKCKISNTECCGRIEAHHILSYRKHLDLRYDVNNGITLCKFHHPRKYSEEERLSPYFLELIKVSL